MWVTRRFSTSRVGETPRVRVGPPPTPSGIHPPSDLHTPPSPQGETLRPPDASSGPREYRRPCVMSVKSEPQGETLYFSDSGGLGGRRVYTRPRVRWVDGEPLLEGRLADVHLNKTLSWWTTCKTHPADREDSTWVLGS